CLLVTCLRGSDQCAFLIGNTHRARQSLAYGSPYVSGPSNSPLPSPVFASFPEANGNGSCAGGHPLRLARDLSRGLGGGGSRCRGRGRRRSRNSRRRR